MDKREHSDSESDEPKKKHKKHSKEKKAKKSKKSKKVKKSRRNSSSDNEDEWVEKNIESKDVKAPVRDDWMEEDANFLLPTFSKEEKKPPKASDKGYEEYNPASSTRELNPYWKDGQGGLPSFQKPKDDDDYNHSYKSSSDHKKSSGGWRKNKQTEDFHDIRRSNSRSSSPELQLKQHTGKESREVLPQPDGPLLTDHQMNDLGAKMIRAEIMGNTSLAAELKAKLDAAKEMRLNSKNNPRKAEVVLLTITNASGTSKPIQPQDRKSDKNDRNAKKNKRVETHVKGERTSYYADDNNQRDIRSMFEREKYSDGRKEEEEFARTIGNMKDSQKDDLVDLFSDNIRKQKQTKRDDRDEAIEEHKKVSKILENCDKCFDSAKMEKELVLHTGEKVYLAIPWHQGLVEDHLVISPIQHVTCSTQLDEEVWEEMNNFRKSLTRVFASQKKDVIFFEIAKNLHKRPHMQIHAIAHRSFELSQFYFKKAILESDVEWAMNKKLVDLKANQNDVRKSIPKGLSYFWVNFGVANGMAHVIEDAERFPSNFAQEVIGGMLNLDVNKWRKPRKENYPDKKIKYLKESLKECF